MGRVLADRYELRALLGRGGMGEVWSALDTMLGREVAVKLLRSPVDDAGAAQLFFREARTAGALNHPGVVTVHDLGRDGDETLFLVMELVHGRTLAQVLREDGPPPVEPAVEWAALIADALEAAHGAGIVHRDLKPGNVMLTPSGAVKVLDFGIARPLAGGGTTSTTIMGTLAYMPPERFESGRQDTRGDLYSLGCLLHELLTGAGPFADVEASALMFAHLRRTPEPPSARRPGVPAGLDALVAQLLAKDPADRPAGAAQVAARLRAVLAAPPAPAHPPTVVVGRAAVERAEPTVRLRRSARPARGGRRPLLVLAAVVAALAVAGGTVAALANGTAPRVRWSFVTKGGPGLTTAVSPSTVYAAGEDGTAYALDTVGHQRWAEHVASASQAESAVARDGDSVYEVADGDLRALDPATGVTKWSFTGRSLTGALTAAGGLVYVGARSGVLYALDAGTGSQDWTYSTNDQLTASPTVVGGYLYLGGTDGEVYCFEAPIGVLVWSADLASPVLDQPAVDGGTVYVAANAGKVFALDAATGSQKWAYTTGPMGASSPAVADGTVYVGSQDHSLYAVDAATGHLRWTFATGGPIDSSPTVGRGTVYVGSDDHSVYAVGTANGAKRWSAATGGAVQGHLLLADSVLYAGSRDGKLYALNP
ncbi:serine/threonine-protein kinase [Kitasatospora viridis]|uniref:non-specific serine/threonine protein kinase n=1 Tax=Kitasatospora viridis TaxID=281105 RepID=A0A561T6U5_9ACTN|nr:serine/threonine-protein kinase [Kitasatospora viridis]TWF82828.1 serine/threonine-protein kinase [Kitasatospora viridis]